MFAKERMKIEQEAAGICCRLEISAVHTLHLITVAAKYCCYFSKHRDYSNHMSVLLAILLLVHLYYYDSDSCYVGKREREEMRRSSRISTSFIKGEAEIITQEEEE
jgi:hypothetical protein